MSLALNACLSVAISYTQQPSAQTSDYRKEKQKPSHFTLFIFQYHFSFSGLEYIDFRLLCFSTTLYFLMLY